MLGYVFLGTTFGLLLQKADFNWIWALCISFFVYAGSIQFVLLGLLGGGLSLLSTALLTLSINSRHLFYGLSFIEKFKSMGKARSYMILTLTDETYSLLCSLKVPKDYDEHKVLFLISLLNHIYWVLGSVLGSILGDFLLFNTQGIDFAMTSLFVVIVVEQWKAAHTHIPALVGLAGGILCLLIFGSSKFILPSLLLSAGVLLVGKNMIQRKEAQA